MSGTFYDTKPVYKDLVEVLKKHQIPALLAADILNTVSRDIVCYFNTKDMQDKYYGEEIIKRITSESEVGGKVGGRRVSWSEVLSDLGRDLQGRRIHSG